MPNSTRTLPKLLGSGVLLGLLALSACETNRTSLFIRGVLPAEVDTTTGGCSFDAANESLLLGGTVDVALASGFTLDLAVANQLIARADRSRLAAETNRITVNRAEVRVTSATAVRRSRFSTLSTGIINPSDGTQPGVGVVSVNVLTPELADELLEELKLGGRQELVAYVKVFGETLGGNDVESDFFQYPFTACAGCLVSFPPRVDGVIDCSSTSVTTSACRLGENTAVPCALCSANEYCIPPN